jgi:hypothetical protein
MITTHLNTILPGAHMRMPCYNNTSLLLLHIPYLITTQPNTTVSDVKHTIVTTIICSYYYIIHRCLQHQLTQSFIFCHECSHVLIQYGPMHWLKGADVVHYFNDKRVILKWVFNFLLACIRHDDIIHKIDVVGFRIFVSPDFYVSHYGFLYNCTSVTYFSIHY